MATDNSPSTGYIIKYGLYLFYSGRSFRALFDFSPVMQSLAFNLFISLAENKYKPGLEKVPSDRPGEIHFPNGQVTFQSHLPSRQKPREIFCELNKQSNLGLAQGKQILTEAACPKGKLEFNFFSSSKFVEKLNKHLIYTLENQFIFFIGPSSPNLLRVWDRRAESLNRQVRLVFCHQYGNLKKQRSFLGGKQFVIKSLEFESTYIYSAVAKFYRCSL